MIVAIDFETTGLINSASTDPHQQPGIVQIGLVVCDNLLEPVDKIDQFINPEIPNYKWEPGAIAAHKITFEQVQSAPTLPEFFQELAGAFIGRQYWVGYNNSFDKTILWYQLLRYGLERKFPWPPREIDVMKVADDFLGLEGKRGNKPPRLMEAYELLHGMKFAGWHNALADVEATLSCLRKLYKEGMVAI